MKNAKITNPTMRNGPIIAIMAFGSVGMLE
jgi:hypothetical protein